MFKPCKNISIITFRLKKPKYNEEIVDQPRILVTVNKKEGKERQLHLTSFVNHLVHLVYSNIKVFILLKI